MHVGAVVAPLHVGLVLGMHGSREDRARLGASLAALYCSSLQRFTALSGDAASVLWKQFTVDTFGPLGSVAHTHLLLWLVSQGIICKLMP